MKKLILISIFLAVYSGVFGQYFQTGQDPASIRWRVIDTKNFQVICPDYYEAEAQRLAGKLEGVYPFGSYSLKHNPAKIPVVLHTQTIRSNGLVAWAPKRSEFFTTPHQSIYPQDWLEQLALHEFRHVVQVNKVNSNLPGWIRLLLGEQGTALAFGAYLPWWLIEGDAVVTETALSRYGRGRLPSFLMEHRAQVLDKGVYSYDKAYLGSYKDFVPDHYKLGYYLTGNMRAKYGTALWEKVFAQTGSKPLSLTPVRKVLKEQTGMNTAENYSDVFDSLRTTWQQEDARYNSAPFTVRTPASRFYTSYTHNHWLNNAEVLSYKTAHDRIPAFVKTGPERIETTMYTPGNVFYESVDYDGEWIIWSERISDPRWHHSGRSLIRMVHSGSKLQADIEPEWKAFSPAVSPGKQHVAVVEADFASQYYISVYRLSDGSLQHRYQSPGNNYFFSPEWISANQLAVIVLTNAGKRLAIIDFSENRLTYLTDHDPGDMKHLHKAGEYLYFIASWSGKNSLYRININNREIELVYEPRFGVESPAVSPDGRKIVLSDYTADGFRLIEIPADHRGIGPFESVQKGNYALAEKLADQEAGIVLFSDSVATAYPSKAYSKAGNLFNFHSWAPVYVDTENYGFTPGVSLMSQDLLGISETVLGYQYDMTEKTGRFTANYSFKGWYPVIDFDFSLGNRASEYMQISRRVDNQGQTVNQDTSMQRFTWGQTSAGLNISLPLSFDKGAFSRLVQPEVQYGFTRYNKHDSIPENFREGKFHSLGYRMYFHQLMRKSYLDMYPDYGIVLDAHFRHSPAGSLRAGHMGALQSVVYLPGLMKNHGIRLYGGAQQKKDGEALAFSDIVRYARGWGRIATTAIYTTGGDYKFPVVYPDQNLFGMLYVRRINASVFADFSRLKGNYYDNGEIAGTYTTDISSVGSEVTADVNMLRFYAPATVGFRSSYLPRKKQVFFELLFSIDFTAL